MNKKYFFVSVIFITSITTVVYLSEESFSDNLKNEYDQKLENAIVTLESLKRESINLNVPDNTVREIKDILSKSKNSHSCKCKRNSCKWKVELEMENLGKLIELVGDFRIEEVSSELFDHFTSAETMEISASRNVPIGLYPAIRACAKFGRNGVPLMLERLREESEYDDYCMKAYFTNSAYYFYEVYGLSAADNVMKLIENENDTMKKKMTELIIPIVERQVNQEIRVNAGKNWVEERKKLNRN